MMTANSLRSAVCAATLGALLFAVTGCASTAAPVSVPKPQPTPRSEEDIERYVRGQYAIVDADLGGEVDLSAVHLVFIGDSITRGWTNPWNEGGELWEAAFSDSATAQYSLNLGVSGDRPEHLLYRLLEKDKGGMGNLDDPAIDPDTIFLMIGTNSLWRDDATAHVAQAIVTVANRLHELRPRAHIVVQSVLPVQDSDMNRLRVEPINALVRRSVDSSGLPHVFSFLDLYPDFLNDGGDQDDALFRDGVHLNKAGYARWYERLAGFLGVTADGSKAQAADSAGPAVPELHPSFTYPNGMRKALIISMDDGNETDRRMIEILNRYRLKGTFHLNSGFLGQPVTWFNEKYDTDIDYVDADEVARLYAGHEVSSHSYDHSNFWQMRREDVKFQVWTDKTQLEEVTGREVAGIAYPYGAAGEFGPDVARGAGHRYGRVAKPNHRTVPPIDPFHWAPTAWPGTALAEFQDYVGAGPGPLSLFMLMGHSYEYVIPGSALDWDAFDDFCAAAARAEDVWSVTMIDYIAYLEALQSAQASIHNGAGRNDSDVQIWVSTPAGPAAVAPGAEFELRRQ